MKILETLHNEELKASEKLEAVTKMVAGIREKYGNSDVEINKVKIPSTNGSVDVGLLTTAEKVAVATNSITNIILQATSIVDSGEGFIFDREFESLVATDAILTNINSTSDSAY